MHSSLPVLKKDEVKLEKVHRMATVKIHNIEYGWKSLFNLKDIKGADSGDYISVLH